MHLCSLVVERIVCCNVVVGGGTHLAQARARLGCVSVCHWFVHVLILVFFGGGFNWFFHWCFVVSHWMSW